MKIQINESYFISEIQDSDIPAYLEHLQEKQIYTQTLNIPYPYTEEDAQEWLRLLARERERWGRNLNWAIRQKDGELIGGIGFHALEESQSHRAELGYWLAKPYWNKGITTEAVKVITPFAFKEFNLARITAHIFHFNKASARVLEKAGFQLEGCLRNFFRKDGQIFDGLLYAAVSRDTLN